MWPTLLGKFYCLELGHIRRVSLTAGLHPMFETIYKDIALFLCFFWSYFFASWCYNNTENLTRFMIADHSANMSFLWVLNLILLKLIRFLKTNWDVHVLFTISPLPNSLFLGRYPRCPCKKIWCPRKKIWCPRAIRILKVFFFSLIIFYYFS